MMGGRLNYKMIVTTAALTCIASCVAPKSSFAGAQKPPLFDKKPVTKLSAEWEKGLCTADPTSGKITYAGKDKTTSFELFKSRIEGAFAIHCSEDKTVIVKDDRVILINRGANHEKSPYDETFTAIYGADEGSTIDYTDFMNEPEEKNLVSTTFGNKVFVLGKNMKTGNLFINTIDIKNSEVDSYDLGKLLKGNVDIMVYKGLIFIAGEAKKGENYLHAFKPGEKLVIFPFKTKKDLKGTVEMWIEHSISGSDSVQEGDLVIKIGKKQIRISIDESQKKLPEKIKIKD